MTHLVNGRMIVPPFPEGMETLVVGMGCFRGAEQRFWETPGVWTTIKERKIKQKKE